MTRKPPYKHSVSGYVRRDGKQVDKYTRGEGSAPKKQSVPKTLRGSSNWSISFTPNDEAYNTSGSPVSALRSAIAKIQRPVVPNKAVLRRINK